MIINSYSDRAHLSRATRSERSPLPSRGEPRAADGEAFSEVPAKDFGALGCARGFRNPKWETEAGNRRKCLEERRRAWEFDPKQSRGSVREREHVRIAKTPGGRDEDGTLVANDRLHTSGLQRYIRPRT